MAATRFALLTCAILLVSGQSVRADVVLFSDDFESGSLDGGKWTPRVDPGCGLSVSSGLLHAYFTGPGDHGHGAYAESAQIALPDGWTSARLTGQWAFVSKVYGEILMSLWRDGNPDANLLVAYSTYGGDVFRGTDSGGSVNQFARSTPSSLTNFELTVAPTGWSFREDRGNGWEELANSPTNLMAGAGSMTFKIGGWEYSVTPMQETQYDNIQFVPEPSCVVVLGLGLAAMLRAARRR